MQTLALCQKAVHHRWKDSGAAPAEDMDVLHGGHALPTRVAMQDAGEADALSSERHRWVESRFNPKDLHCVD